MCPDLLCQSADHNTYRILGISGTHPTSKTLSYSVRGNDLNDVFHEYPASNYAARRIAASSRKMPILEAFSQIPGTNALLFRQAILLRGSKPEQFRIKVNQVRVKVYQGTISVPTPVSE